MFVVSSCQHSFCQHFFWSFMQIFGITHFTVINGNKVGVDLVFQIQTDLFSYVNHVVLMHNFHKKTKDSFIKTRSTSVPHSRLSNIMLHYMIKITTFDYTQARSCIIS